MTVPQEEYIGNICEVHVAQSLVLIFGKSVQSFVDDCLPFFAWPLYCIFLYYLRFLITILESSHFYLQVLSF